MDQGGRAVLMVIIWEGGGGGVGDAKEREIDLQISDLQRLTSLYQIDSPLTVHTGKKRLQSKTDEGGLLKHFFI